MKIIKKDRETTFACAVRMQEENQELKKELEDWKDKGCRNVTKYQEIISEYKKELEDCKKVISKLMKIYKIDWSKCKIGDKLLKKLKEIK